MTEGGASHTQTEEVKRDRMSDNSPSLHTVHQLSVLHDTQTSDSSKVGQIYFYNANTWFSTVSK